MLLNAIPIDLRKLGHFQAVAEELNFTRAARRVHLTQQALSTSIRQLERELGVVLMERSTRDVRLTEAGRALLDEAPRLLALAEVAASRAVAAERGEVGELHVGHTPAVTGKEVNDLAVRVRLLHPSIRISARQMYPDELIDGLLAARIEVGLGRGFASRAGVKVSILAQQPVNVAVAREHPLAGQDLVTLVELEPYSLVLWGAPGQSGYSDLLVGLCRRAGFEPRIELNPIQGTPPASAVIGTDGFAFVTDRPGPAVDGEVVVLELGDRLRVPLMAAVLERPPSALLSRFLAAAGSEAESSQADGRR